MCRSSNGPKFLPPPPPALEGVPLSAETRGGRASLSGLDTARPLLTTQRFPVLVTHDGRTKIREVVFVFLHALLLLLPLMCVCSCCRNCFALLPQKK